MRKLLAIITPIILGINILASTTMINSSNVQHQRDAVLETDDTYFDLGTGIKLISISEVIDLLNVIKAGIDLAHNPNWQIKDLTQRFYGDTVYYVEDWWTELPKEDLVKLINKDGFTVLNYTVEFKLYGETSRIIESLKYQSTDDGIVNKEVDNWFDAYGFFAPKHSYYENLRIEITSS